MREKNTKTSLVFTLFLLTKLTFLHLSDCQPMDIRGLFVRKHGKLETENSPQQQVRLFQEELGYVSLLHASHETKRRKERNAPHTRYLHKRGSNVHSGVRAEIARALAHHIEGMEPNFKSATFQQLWSELKEPLTVVMRPGKIEDLLTELQKCNLGNTPHGYEIPSDLDGIKRDLVICKIYETLEKNEETSSAEKSKHNKGDYASIWSLLKQPLTSCFKVAELSSLMNELAQCLPRFELAGIKYQVPSKMSEVKRDVIICKVDELFNKPHVDDDSTGSGTEV
ncbi:uncharacterized protein LOC111335497 isoform X1 [Stylophora pistillata]|uniref:uncharacterized protein LOC111335497 isoform X1 n=1 Tax=Stylophora pistillata TaxID=50429 RepID=UPI000C0522F7|nr:uncharacterized protein LOC111335497 isoform X1 [Stylophora pistillata]